MNRTYLLHRLISNIKKIYQEFPKKFWIVVAVSFIDRIGGTLLFPFFSLYITQRFERGDDPGGLCPGIILHFWVGGAVHRRGINGQIWPPQPDPFRSGFQRNQHTLAWDWSAPMLL